jgi:IS30 family transposase
VEDREVIHNINKGGFGQAEIGQSTVSKELSRNKGKRGYRSKQADDLAKERQELKRALPTSPRKPERKTPSLISPMTESTKSPSPGDHSPASP